MVVEYIGTRGPRFWGFCLGTGWVIIITALFGVMVHGYLELFGIKGAMFAVTLLPLSAPAYPFVLWYLQGSFPWLWVAGLVLAWYLGRIIMND